MLLHRNAWQGFTTAILLYRCKIVIDELDRVHAGGRKEDVSEEADSMGFCVKKSYQHHNQI